MTIQIRRDSAADWTTENPTLADGQPGYETDTGRLKIGDGSTAWTSLSYFDKATKTVTLENPATNDRIALWHNLTSIDVTGVSFASVGGTSVGISVEFGTAIASGTVIHSDTCASSTPEYDVTPSGTTTIPANRIVILEIGTVTGSVTQLSVTLHF